MNKIVGLLMLGLIIGLCGCSSKTPATLDEFTKTVKDAGYEIMDVSARNDANIAKAVIIAYKHQDHRMEFFILTSEENAVGTFARNKTRLEAMEGGNTNTSVTASNYNSYTLTTKDQFYALYRVADTMIYLRVPKDDKKAVTELIKSLGY